jgi:8-oxo-dGTP pyrophosphatase MutT (NUDIX family)
MKKSPWKKISSSVVYKNKWYSIRKDKVVTPDGNDGEYNVIQRPPAVFIIALDADKNIKLINLYSYPTSTYSIEIPGGSSDDQTPLSAAKRELQEETGLKARKWKLVGKFQVANGLTDEIGCVYLATELSDTGKNSQKEEGIEKVISVSIEEVFSMIRRGRITDGQTIVSLHLASEFLK